MSNSVTDGTYSKLALQYRQSHNNRAYFNCGYGAALTDMEIWLDGDGLNELPFDQGVCEALNAVVRKLHSMHKGENACVLSY